MGGWVGGLERGSESDRSVSGFMGEVCVEEGGEGWVDGEGSDWSVSCFRGVDGDSARTQMSVYKSNYLLHLIW